VLPHTDPENFRMPFTADTYPGLISERTEAQARFVPEPGADLAGADVLVIGSGIGGGLLADQLADAFRRAGSPRRVLVLEAGSYLFPTHVYNVSRLDNGKVAGRYGVSTVRQIDAGEQRPDHLLDQLQMNLGGRSIFWSGLIPQIRPWELEFFPPRVRDDVQARLGDAGRILNESRSLGETPAALAAALAQVPEITADFDVRETPRAVHQPYLTGTGVPSGRYWFESTGVFNTAELLLNALGLPPGDADRRLDLLLNRYVESVTRRGDGRYDVVAQDVVAGRSATFTAPVVVLAAGSLGSPKILRRSPVFDGLPAEVQALVGKGLTDHPTTSWVEAMVTEMAGVPVPPDRHAKIILYSKGRREADGSLAFPFNVELNVNPVYWHLRENDPDDVAAPFRQGLKSFLEFKFSFGNCLDDGNDIVFDDPYRPRVEFGNLSRADELAGDRFRRSAGWTRTTGEIWPVLREVADRLLATCRDDGQAVRPLFGYVGENGKGFGYGTVHHAVGTLRMPARTGQDDPDFGTSVVDEDLRVHGEHGLYVCDMSVLPFSSAANPVRTLTALTLRLVDRIVTDH
jgi:choline dehydrogenase-like flavoprotein